MRNKLSQFGVGVAFAVFTATTAMAGTVTYNWSSSLRTLGGGTIVGSGQLVAETTISMSFDDLYSGYLVDSITGTYGSSTITGLGGIDTLGANDNLINTSGGTLDGYGIDFFVSPTLPGWGPEINLYNNGSGYTDNGPTGTGTFVLTSVSATAPEPPTAGLLGTGIFGIVAVLKRRVRAARIGSRMRRG